MPSSLRMTPWAYPRMNMPASASRIARSKGVIRSTLDSSPDGSTARNVAGSAADSCSQVVPEGAGDGLDGGVELGVGQRAIHRPEAQPVRQAALLWPERMASVCAREGRRLEALGADFQDRPRDVCRGNVVLDVHGEIALDRQDTGQWLRVGDRQAAGTQATDGDLGHDHTLAQVPFRGKAGVELADDAADREVAVRVECGDGCAATRVQDRLGDEPGVLRGARADGAGDELDRALRVIDVRLASR